MKTITLKILAEDIRTSDFSNSQDCALGRSVKRHNSKLEGHFDYVSETNYSNPIQYPKEVLFKVLAMYVEELTPQDFEFQLEVPDNW